VHGALGQLDLLPAARLDVGALAVEMDRGMRGRALDDVPVGRSSGSGGRRPVSVISPSGSPVVEVAPRRASAT